MLKIGNYIINENAIAYINLNAKKRLSQRDIEGVGIYFMAPNHICYMDGVYGAIPDYLFFSGKDAEALREYFRFSNILDLNTFV